MATPNPDPTTVWPAVPYAYEYVQPSYELLMQRYEAADTRLSSLVTFVTAATFAALTLAVAARPDISFRSPWFVLAIALFVGASVLALWGWTWGTLRLTDPAVLYEEALREPEWEFKKNQLHYAGRSFLHNATVVKRKSNIARLVAGAFLLEILALITWMAVGT